MREIPELLPLFPLPNVVLFPHMSLPLHVFEPRYRKLVQDIQHGHKTLGMLLLQPGWESDYHGRPAVYPVGCAGTLQQVETLADGRYNIVLEGVCRFRVQDEHAGEPYRLARVTPLNDEAGAALELDAARQQVLAAIAKAPDGPAILVMQAELSHALFVNAMAQSLSLGALERQSLLECDSLLARYLRLLEILDFRWLEHTYGRNQRGAVH
jgi:Lon protease-like protein